MKKLLIVPVICAVLSGCSDSKDNKNVANAWTSQGRSCSTKIAVIEGHKYIIMDGSYSGCIVHAASCECMDK